LFLLLAYYYYAGILLELEAAMIVKDLGLFAMVESDMPPNRGTS